MRRVFILTVGATLGTSGCFLDPHPASAPPSSPTPPACPETATPNLTPTGPSTPPSPTACTLYDKGIMGLTLKRAVFETELVGATEGGRALYGQGHSHDQARYDSFWSCTAFAAASKTAWCECPRGPNREFEDTQEKETPVVWIDTRK